MEPKVRKIEKTLRKITFDKGCAKFVLDALKKVVPEPKCRFCNDLITDKNFGGVINKKFFCSNIVCLVRLVDSKEFKVMNGEVDKK